MANEPRKPTGITGPFEVKVTESGASVEWVTAGYSPRKDEIEAGVVEGFLKDAHRQQLCPFAVAAAHQNLENDLDYTLETSNGRRYLELMEIAPLDDLRGCYDEATGAYKPYDLTAGVITKVLEKSRRYSGSASGTPILLLLYNTHWAFNLGDTALMLLQYWAHARRHCFERVYYYRPLSERLGTVYDVYPTPEEHWSGFDPEVCRDDVAYNLVPGAIHVQPEGGAMITLSARLPRTQAKSLRRNHKR